jgi:hypothetical protein
MKWFVSIAGALLFASFLAAQDGQDHTQWIADAKAELHAHGIKTENVGPCGPFQIINLAAYRHKDTKIGLLSKPNGNGCEWPAGSGNRYSVDYLVYPNGAGGDMLIASEVENKPTWHIGDPVPADVPRWRAPIAPDFAPDPPIPPPPPPPMPDLGPILARLDALERHATADDAALAKVAKDVDALNTALNAVTVRVNVLEAKPTVTGCKAALKLGVTTIPISCEVTK